MVDQGRYGVVVVHYSGLEHLAACLASARNEVGPGDIAVVHTGMDVRVEALVASYGAIYLSLPSNPGYGSALNVGIREFSGRPVLCSNSDIAFPAGGVEALAQLAELSRGIAFPAQALGEQGPIHPDTLLDQLSLLDSSRRWLGLGRAGHGRCRSTFVDGLVASRATYQFDGRRYSGSGACFAVSSGALDTLGGIPEEFFLQEEDRLLCLRAAQLSVPLLLVGSVVVVHEGGMRSRRATGVDLDRRRAAEFVAYNVRYGFVPLRAYALVAAGVTVRKVGLHLQLMLRLTHRTEHADVGK